MVKIERREEGDVTVLTVEGHLVGDPETRGVQDHVRDAIKYGSRKILLNLKGVPWMNSLGAGVMIASHVTAIRAEAVLGVCCLASRVEALLKTMHVIPVPFQPYATEAEALASFGEVYEPEGRP